MEVGRICSLGSSMLKAALSTHASGCIVNTSSCVSCSDLMHTGKVTGRHEADITI